MDEQDTHVVAASLLALSSTAQEQAYKYGSPPVSRRNSKEEQDTPDKQSRKCEFVMTGVKRTRDPEVLSVTYSSGEATIMVPLHKYDSDYLFNTRRRLAATRLFDNGRADVYCVWANSLVNMRISDARWVKFRDTFREQRFMYKNLQLVVLRFKCQKECDEPCFNCATPSRRKSCETPLVYHFVMPLPTGTDSACDETVESVMNEFEPIHIHKETDEWKMRIPALRAKSL